MNTQFISNFLTHWTGKDKDDEKGFKNLKSIVTSNQLFLKYCPHFNPNKFIDAKLKMTCFTDIPHHLSNEHCKRYGKFGIAFKKDNLIKYGVNPVFYILNNKKDDFNKVYELICDIKKYNIPIEIKESLERFFGYVQEYNDRSNNQCYYEREWRILENNLELEESEVVPPGKKGIKSINTETTHYLQFDKNDIEFLICPKLFAKELSKDFNYPVIVYEYLVL
jgi:hypothetical protein